MTGRIEKQPAINTSAQHMTKQNIFHGYLLPLEKYAVVAAARGRLEPRAPSLTESPKKFPCTSQYSSEVFKSKVWDRDIYSHQSFGGLVEIKGKSRRAEFWIGESSCCDRCAALQSYLGKQIKEGEI